MEGYAKKPEDSKKKKNLEYYLERSKDKNSFSDYLKEVYKVPLLEDYELGILCKRRDKGDMEAVKEIVKSNLRLVMNAAKKYLKKGVTYQDLVQVGNVGLIRAAEKYDFNTGFKFTTYASWWIKQSFMREIGNASRIIRLPIHQYETDIYIKKIVGYLRRMGEKNPSIKRIMKFVKDKDPEKIKEILNGAYKDAKSLDEKLKNDESDEQSTYTVFLKSENKDQDAVFLEDAIDKALEGLNEREKEIIKLRFGLYGLPKWSLDKVGKKLGVTRERTRQLQEKALKKLRHPSRTRHLRDFYLA